MDEDEADEANEAAETASEEEDGVARRCWRVLLDVDAFNGNSDGDGDGGRLELLRAAAAAGAAAPLHVLLDAGAGRHDARALLAALARAPVPRALPAAAYACALANHAANHADAEVAAAFKHMETRMHQVDLKCKRALKASPDMSARDAARLRDREVDPAKREVEAWGRGGREEMLLKWEAWRRAHPAAERAAHFAIGARATDYWRAVVRLVAAGVDPAAGDADGAEASPAAVMLLRPDEVPAALVADLLGPRFIKAAGAGASAPASAAGAAAAAVGEDGAEEVGPPPAHAAAAQGDVGLMRELLRGGAVGARVPGSSETALHVVGRCTLN